MEVEVEEAGTSVEEPMIVDEGYHSDMEVDDEVEDILSPTFRRLSVSE
jgi:hypothetical protein